MSKTRVYIDGFNLYHGIIRHNALHWLDLSAFAARLNRGLPVDRIIYCTAMVSGTRADPDKAMRQDIYHRAIAIACPNVEIVKGQFTSHKKFQLVAGCHESPPCVTRVIVTNEKGSDVNIASRLLHDAHMSLFDRAIVVSGDSDLVEPIRLVTREIKKIVWVRNRRDVQSRELDNVASHYGKVSRSVLDATQLPDLVAGNGKVYRKPQKWTQVAPKAAKEDVAIIACPHPECRTQLKTCRFV